MEKILSLSNPLSLMLKAFILFLVIAMVHDGDGLSDSFKSLLTLTSFVFGFYITNLISQSRSKHAKVIEALREEGGHLRAIYFLSSSAFPKAVVDEQRVAIDSYLMTGMDYKTIDQAKGGDEFKQLFAHLMAMQPETKKQEAAWSNIIRIMSDISKSRTRVEALVKERVSSFEWMTIAILLGLVIFFVFTLNTGSGLSVIITSFIATSLTMLVIILYNLDSLRWKEKQLFWEPLEELFLSLDLLPYYPKILISAGRVQLVKGQPVRLAEYPHPYPDVSGKTVEIHS